MTINLKMPEAMNDLKPRITVFGVGGAGGNAVNNMIQAGLEGVEFVVANTDAQALAMSSADSRIQMGTAITEGLGAGSQPKIGAAAAEEAMAEILDHVTGSHMVFITAGMGGGTGTGAAPVIARLAREQQILTIGVVTKPFQFEGQRRMEIAEAGIAELAKHVDTLIIIPNQNLFRVANERTTFADAFAMADQVLYSGVAGITDLMVKEGLINLDFADVRTIMTGMGKAMMGTGEACGEKRAVEAAEAAIANPLLDDVSMKGARGLLISITGGEDLTLYEVDEAATRIRQEVDVDANIILGATFDNALEGYIRVSVVATGIASEAGELPEPAAVDEEQASGEREMLAGGATIVGQDHSTGLSNDVIAGLGAALAEPRGGATGSREQRADVAAALGRFTEPGERISATEAHAHGAAIGDATGAGRAAVDLSDPARAVAKDDVTVRRLESRPGIAMPQPHDGAAVAMAREDEAMHDPARPFIPPKPAEAERRMPRAEEFPMPAQRELAAHVSGPNHHGVEAQKRKTGFLERLASVGLGRRQDEADGTPVTEPAFTGAPAAASGPHPMGDQAPNRVQGARASASMSQAEPAREHTLLPNADEDDELEIPAFLRRSAN